MRLCDGCGIKVPRFRPRVNQNGQMLCDGCAEGRPGGEGRPIGYHGSKDDPDAAAEKACDKFVPGGPDGSDPHTCATCYWAIGAHSAKAGGPDGHGGFGTQGSKDTVISGQKTIRLAHDSGDGETIYHCPFCGGGQVTGGSDGSVECGFCHTLFTVQVQPEHAAMPQTINGVPQQMPGMPGEVGGAPNPVGAPPPGGDTGTDAFVPPDAFAPPETPAAPGAPPKAAAIDPNSTTSQGHNVHQRSKNKMLFSDCKTCGWTGNKYPWGAEGSQAAYEEGEEHKRTTKAASRFYLNAQGVALPEESYIRHLAIAFADEPYAVIEQVREERAG